MTPRAYVSDAVRTPFGRFGPRAVGVAEHDVVDGGRIGPVSKD
ncbi:hypothetical protein [Nocardia higoensis]|nr:hypothetical protein [Nocardia higoensis]